jgi:hypothetical protein
MKERIVRTNRTTSKKLSVVADSDLGAYTRTFIVPDDQPLQLPRDCSKRLRAFFWLESPADVHSVQPRRTTPEVPGAVVRKVAYAKIASDDNVRA